MVFKNCLGMMASVSMLIIGMGAATPVKVVNFSMTGPQALAAGWLACSRPQFDALLTLAHLRPSRWPHVTGDEAAGRAQRHVASPEQHRHDRTGGDFAGCRYLMALSV